MGDQFEKFINENREHFDDSIPSEELWVKIDSKLEGPVSKFNWTVIWKVAAIFLLVSTVYLTIDRINSKNNKPELSNIQVEFLQAEAFYSSLISEKRKEISSLANADLKGEFLKDIDQLDVMYEELKQTFNQTTSDEKIMDAMVANLQMRIQILNQQISILEKLNNVKNESDKTLEI